MGTGLLRGTRPPALHMQTPLTSTPPQSKPKGLYFFTAKKSTCFFAFLKELLRLPLGPGVYTLASPSLKSTFKVTPVVSTSLNLAKN